MCYLTKNNKEGAGKRSLTLLVQLSSASARLERVGGLCLPPGSRQDSSLLHLLSPLPLPASLVT